ncbi:hypothetical protein LTR36_008524 [Oleoguttula mirabilis]|uniref:F-box domain-containing protein n=1 Tax=Oleoguttula mirabilis TaxID=1507867 RepID=A0AAV9JUK6_9PEZI|nr:hypothetical protein LTR36_008524 [Oleoguttula mirabilis]
MSVGDSTAAAMHTPVSTANATPKRTSLLGIPAELRLKIYDYALQDVHLTVWYRIGTRGNTKRSAHALLQVCRLVRVEIRPVFFSAITFDFPDRHAGGHERLGSGGGSSGAF